MARLKREVREFQGESRGKEKIYRSLDLEQNDSVWCLFFFFFSKPKETTSFHTFKKKKSVATAIYRSVWKYQFRGFNFRWLHRVGVE